MEIARVVYTKTDFRNSMCESSVHTKNRKCLLSITQASLTKVRTPLRPAELPYTVDVNAV